MKNMIYDRMKYSPLLKKRIIKSIYNQNNKFKTDSIINLKNIINKLINNEKKKFTIITIHFF